jgi:hypothetical protein
MQLSRISAALGLMMLVTGIASAQVTAEQSKDADFSKYKTFMWIKSPNATNPLTNQRIVNDVDSALTSKGLRLVTSDPDICIAAHTATEKQQTLQTFYDGFAGGWRWRDGVGSATTTVTSYTVGTLVIDIFDSRTKAAIWRGTAMKTLSDNPQRRAESIDKAIAKMFKLFAPTKGVGSQQ